MIVSLFLIGVWVTALTLLHHAQGFTEQWRRDLPPVTCTGDKSKPDFYVAIQVSEPEKERLTGQFQQVVNEVRHHFWMSSVFYETQFVAKLMAAVLAAVAAITLLFITSVGWQKANPFLQNIFVLATASATLSAAIPSILQQQQNMESNIIAYREYASLANEMCSYAVTGNVVAPTNVNQKASLREQNDAASFILHVDAELKRLNNIEVHFGNEMPNFTEPLRQGSGGSLPTQNPQPSAIPTKSDSK